MPPTETGSPPTGKAHSAEPTSRETRSRTAAKPAKSARSAQKTGQRGNPVWRALRPLVVLRKITFGHRSDAGAKRMATLMSVAETARRRGHRASRIYFECYTRPPDRVLRSLYAEA